MNRVTLTDVAKLAGVSKSTVSRALRNDAAISEAVRTRLRALAEEAGYRPDPALAKIAAHRWRGKTADAGSVLAYLHEPAAGPAGEGARMIATTRAAATAMGYGLEVFDLRATKNPAALSRVIFQRGIRGVIVGRLHTPGLLEGFDWSQVAAVGAGVGAQRQGGHMVRRNIRHAVQTAWARARETGHRRIAAVIHRDPARASSEVNDLNAATMLLELDRDGHRDPRSMLFILEGEYRPARLRAWLDLVRPDALVIPRRLWLERLRELGSGAAEVSVVCTKVHPEDVGALAGVDAADEEVARTAVSFVHGQITSFQMGTPAHPCTLLVEGGWVEGPSLRRRK